MCLMNRRSYRLSRKQKEENQPEYDLSKVAFLVLFKLLRKFREENKHNLNHFYSQSSQDSPKFSKNKSEKSTIKNKRKKKIKGIEKEEEKNEYIDKHNKFQEKYSNPQDKGLMPTKYKDLFTNLRQSEDDTRPLLNGIKGKHYPPKFQNKFFIQETKVMPKIEIYNEPIDE